MINSKCRQMPVLCEIVNFEVIRFFNEKGLQRIITSSPEDYQRSKNDVFILEFGQQVIMKFELIVLKGKEFP